MTDRHLSEILCKAEPTPVIHELKKTPRITGWLILGLVVGILLFTLWFVPGPRETRERVEVRR